MKSTTSFVPWATGAHDWDGNGASVGAAAGVSIMEPNIEESRPDDEARIAGMLSLAIGADPSWSADDLQGLLAHQWAAELAVDLDGMAGLTAGQIRTMGDQASPAIRTFGDLIWHRQPPLELLKLVKEFAKVVSAHPVRRLPEDLTKVVYLAAVAAARRSGHAISTQDEETLVRVAEWAVEQPWVDDRTRELMKVLASG
jgi:hypothetical protein